MTGGDQPITISPGPIPTFTWSGGNANRVVVQEWATSDSNTQGVVEIWAISGVANIASPLTYGTPPEGTQVKVQPQPLHRGPVYRVLVERVGGKDSLYEFKVEE